MPARNKTTNMKRKKPTQKQPNPPRLQFIEGNENSDGASTSNSRRSEELECDENDVIENSQPTMVKREFHRVEKDMDRQLKEAGMYEEGMTDSQKEDILNVILESRTMAGDTNECNNNYFKASGDLFSNNDPHSKAKNNDPKKNFEVASGRQDVYKFSDDDDDFEIPATVTVKEKKYKPRNIFTTFSVENVKKMVKSADATIKEKDESETVVELDHQKETVTESDTNTPDCKKSGDSTKRPMLLRPSSSKKQINKDRESSTTPLNHIPLFAPTHTAPRRYTQVIRGYFDNYLENLAQIKKLPPRVVSWDNPVVVGRHFRNTIDAFRPGHRIPDWASFCQTDMKDCESDAKKPRLDNGKSSSVTNSESGKDCKDDLNDDDDNNNNNDGEEEEDEEVKSYLKNDDVQFHPEKCQKSYGRRRSPSEEPVYIEIPHGDSPEESLESESPAVSPNKKAKISRNSSQEEEDTQNVNQNSQGFMEKLMGFPRQNNTSLLSAFLERALPWKNPSAKQDDRHYKNVTAICPICQKKFSIDEIDDHAAKCGIDDDDEDSQGHAAGCYMCQRVIAGVPVQCGRHPKPSNANDGPKNNESVLPK